ncbi:spore cortex biosynthesis protein YabQ [Marininema halotolerans]|uniref:Spore cortex biosynthesis protein YabQ n=1 Tax=Marininema halotolerans TaxID=1155944 RepID=A0A1I6TBF7_9BACL|nr:spore cortex biosynthesis protein YabQ [Marininema halotolerans]SFS86500.1 spore cortex biosynthesis protein YabQ [Marininema halotolerans]
MTLFTQWATMGVMLGSGWFMGMLLDAYRILARRFRLQGWVISLIDLLYWIATALLVFSLLLWSNWGELRFTVFIAVILGWVVYYYWFSRLITKVIQWLLNVVEYTIRLVIRVFVLTLWVPFITCWRLVLRLMKGLVRLFWGLIRFILWLLTPVGRLFAPLGRWIQEYTAPAWRPIVHGSKWLYHRFHHPNQDDDTDDKKE